MLFGARTAQSVKAEEVQMLKTEDDDVNQTRPKMLPPSWWEKMFGKKDADSATEEAPLTSST